MKSGKYSLDNAKEFKAGDFSGKVYFSETPGFEVSEVIIDGQHLQKTLEIESRMYFVQEGTGEFVVDDINYQSSAGEIFLIVKGSTYSYSGKMRLLEINYTK
jgi:hypothetical protein